MVVAGIGVFFIYTGLEVGAGQWEASFCRGHLHLSPGVTGLAAFGYWGALTAVRISLALVPRPVAPRAVVRYGSALAVIAAAVIWWQPGPTGTVIAFAVLGGALAGERADRAAEDGEARRLELGRDHHAADEQQGGGSGRSTAPPRDVAEIRVVFSHLVATCPGPRNKLLSYN